LLSAMNTNLRRMAVLCCAASIVMFVLGGCGGPAGPERYEVSGKATFGGQPIPAGKIMFVPDRAAANNGPRGIAKIENGQYKTLPDEGAVAGLQIVQIQGYDGVCPPGWSGSDFGKPIFKRYDTKANLPAEATSIDFDVPVKR
jgi:hypothetical protein